MTKPPPKLIRINRDDSRAAFVGRADDNRQFFLTHPFVPAMGGNPGREFLALYVFDADGVLLEAKINDLGTREQSDEDSERSLRENQLVELSKVSYRNIEVAPFRVERFGIEFGLIPQAPDDDEVEWSVTAEPGDYMSFYPPWDGDYDT